MWVFRCSALLCILTALSSLTCNQVQLWRQMLWDFLQPNQFSFFLTREVTLFFNYKSIPERLLHCGCPIRASGHQWAAVFVGLWIKGGSDGRFRASAWELDGCPKADWCGRPSEGEHVLLWCSSLWVKESVKWINVNANESLSKIWCQITSMYVYLKLNIKHYTCTFVQMQVLKIMHTKINSGKKKNAKIKWVNKAHKLLKSFLFKKRSLILSLYSLTSVNKTIKCFFFFCKLVKYGTNKHIK